MQENTTAGLPVDERYVLTEEGKFGIVTADDVGIADVYVESKSELEKLAKRVRDIVQRRCMPCRHCGTGNWPTSGPPCRHPKMNINGVPAPCKAIRVCPAGRSFSDR